MSDKYKKLISRRIRAIRKKMGMTTNNFPEFVGFTKGQTLNWETGRAQPNFDQLGQIAEACNVPITWFFRDDDEGETLLVPLEHVGIVRQIVARVLGS